MKEGEGIKRLLAIVIIIIIIVFILMLVILLPFFIEKVKADTRDREFIIDLQIGNPTAVLNLPSNLTEFKTERELVQVSLLEAPFISKSGTAMIAVRDLETLFSAQVEWRFDQIRVIIPKGIISKNKISFILTEKDFIIKHNRAFISIRTLSQLLKTSEIIWVPETMGIRLILIWHN